MNRAGGEAAASRWPCLVHKILSPGNGGDYFRESVPLATRETGGGGLARAASRWGGEGE
jgi:hypothetical protein